MARQVAFAVDVDETEDEMVSQGIKLKSICCNNFDGVAVFVKLYSGLAADVVVGTTVPDYVIMVPTLANVSLTGMDLPFPDGFTVAAVLEPANSGTTGPGTASDVTVSIEYHED